MSNDTPIVCPNCGFHAEHNYCAQCGQETHLHKESFGGLVAHFFGHYFHYDSKFWKTMRTLWAKPGHLTEAYLARQRMRYIAPISLYIFISAVFFLLSSGMHGFYKKHDKEVVAEASHLSDGTGNMVPAVMRGVGNVLDPADTATGGWPGADEPEIAKKFDKKMAALKNDKEVYNSFKEKINHALPRIFFFMIPVMGLVLKVLFARRKGTYYVAHTIFALHYHSFWFSLWAISLFAINTSAGNILNIALMAVAFVYLIVALRKVYSIKWLKAIIYSILIGFSYTLFLVITVILSSLLIVAMS